MSFWYFSCTRKSTEKQCHPFGLFFLECGDNVAAILKGIEPLQGFAAAVFRLLFIFNPFGVVLIGVQRQRRCNIWTALPVFSLGMKWAGTNSHRLENTCLLDHR